MYSTIVAIFTNIATIVFSVKNLLRTGFNYPANYYKKRLYGGKWDW